MYIVNQSGEVPDPIIFDLQDQDSILFDQNDFFYLPIFLMYKLMSSEGRIRSPLMGGPGQGEV